MPKYNANKIRSDEQMSLQNTANLIFKRVEEVSVTPAKLRALELARLVIANTSSFGARELADAQIIALLQQEGIGLPTFKKALSTARKQLVQKPPRKTEAKSIKTTRRIVDQSSQTFTPPAMQAPTKLFAAELDLNDI